VYREVLSNELVMKHSAVYVGVRVCAHTLHICNAFDSMRSPYK